MAANPTAASTPAPREIEDDNTRLQRFLRTQGRGTWLAIGVFSSRRLGKKCLLARLTAGIYFEEPDPTESWDFYKTVEVFGHGVSMGFRPDYSLDLLAGRSHNAFFILTYNVGNYESFDSLEGLYEEVMAMQPPHGLSVPWTGGLVIAMASDLSSQPDAVSTDSGGGFARSKVLGFLETAAKAGYGCTASDFVGLTTHSLLLLADKQGN